MGNDQEWIKFEYIKSIRYTLANTMSRLVNTSPDTHLDTSPESQEYGYCISEKLHNASITNMVSNVDSGIYKLNAVLFEPAVVLI